LQTGNDGNPICPVCEENIGGENNWRAHVELEKKKLAQMVESLKSQRSSPFDVHNIMNMSYSQAAEKREKELQRIRSNQEKRLRGKCGSVPFSPMIQVSAKNTVFTLSHLKDDKHSYTSATTEEVLDSRSGSTSSQHFGDLEKSYCKGCERQQEFLVLSNMLDEPRCMDCFQKRRQQIGGLPSTITQSPDEACKEDRTLSTPSRSNRTTPSSSTTSPINGRSSVTENGHASPLAARVKEELTPEVPEKRQRLDMLA
ncbi:Protein F43G6.4, partial [Aphelenchoides avenae]